MLALLFTRFFRAVLEATLRALPRLHGLLSSHLLLFRPIYTGDVIAIVTVVDLDVVLMVHVVQMILDAVTAIAVGFLISISRDYVARLGHLNSIF